MVVYRVCLDTIWTLCIMQITKRIVHAAHTTKSNGLQMLSGGLWAATGIDDCLLMAAPPEKT